MRLDQLQKQLNYHFKDESLLLTALTHRSYGSVNYERLEFLGDSILNFAVAELLFKGLKKEDEGDLSRIRASLVNQTTLAELALKISLFDFLRLGEGELKSGGFKRPSILADAMEAIFAAIYLDSGMAASQATIGKLYRPLIESLDTKTAGKDSKTGLQEILQSHRIALPVYKVVEVLGVAHDQEFVVECHIDSLQVVTQAHGPSRRQAEQEAASIAIEKLKTMLLPKTHRHKNKASRSNPSPTPVFDQGYDNE